MSSKHALLARLHFPRGGGKVCARVCVYGDVFQFSLDFVFSHFGPKFGLPFYSAMAPAKLAPPRVHPLLPTDLCGF